MIEATKRQAKEIITPLTSIIPGFFIADFKGTSFSRTIVSKFK